MEKKLRCAFWWANQAYNSILVAEVCLPVLNYTSACAFWFPPYQKKKIVSTDNFMTHESFLMLSAVGEPGLIFTWEAYSQILFNMD